jgi:hypothetical protein
LAWFSLSRYGLHKGALFDRAFRSFVQPLRQIHSGHIGDYVAFLTFGVAAFGGVLALLMHVLR